MMNFASFMCVMTVFAGTIAGCCAPYAHHAGVLWLFLFTVFGLLSGLGFGVLSSIVSHRVLFSKKLHGAAEAFLYLLAPLPFLAAAILAPVLLAAVVFG